MSALLVIGALEAVICVVCLLGAKRNLRRFALLLLIVTAPLEVYRTELAGLNLSLFRLSLAIALATVLLVPGSRRTLRQMRSNPVLLAYLTFAAVMLLSLLTMSENSGLGARLLAQVILGVTALATVSSLAATEPVARIVRYILIGAGLPLVAAAWQRIAPTLDVNDALPFLSLLPVPEGLEVTRGSLPTFEETPRMRGTFGDPSHFGTYLLIVGAAALASAVAASRRGATHAVLGLCGLLMCIVLAVFGTYSRTAWMGLVAAIAIVTLSLWHRLAADPARWRRAAVLPLVIACSFIALTAPFASAINGRLDPSAAGNVVSNSAHERTVTVALDDLIGYPLTGVGVADLGPQLQQAVRSSGAHSSYLTVAAELGVPGLLLLLLGFMLVVRMLHRRMMTSTDPALLMLQGLAAGYIGFAIANLSYDLWWDDFHWLVIGLIIAACSDRSACDAPPQRLTPGGKGP